MLWILLILYDHAINLTTKTISVPKCTIIFSRNLFLTTAKLLKFGSPFDKTDVRNRHLLKKKKNFTLTQITIIRANVNFGFSRLTNNGYTNQKNLNVQK